MIKRREFSISAAFGTAGAIGAGWGLGVLPVAAQAQAQNYKEGSDYLVLDKPAPTEAAAGKVEVACW